MGKYENPKEEEFGEIYVLYQVLEKRINELYSKDKIDSLTKDRWITYLKRKLNYDSISALSRFQISVNGLIESSKPLTLFLNRDIILESPVQTTAAEKEFLIQKIIETLIAPLLVTQQDYLLFATKVLDILNQSAIKKSEKVLEYVLAQSKNEDAEPIEPNSSSHPGITVLGAPFTWDSFLRTSLKANGALKHSLYGNQALKDIISEISDEDFAEIEANYKFGEHGRMIPKKEKHNPPQE